MFQSTVLVFPQNDPCTAKFQFTKGTPIKLQYKVRGMCGWVPNVDRRMFSEREEGGNITVDSATGTRFEGESTVRNMSKGVLKTKKLRN